MNARTLIISIAALLVLAGAFVVLADGETRPATERVSDGAPARPGPPDGAQAPAEQPLPWTSASGSHSDAAGAARPPLDTVESPAESASPATANAAGRADAADSSGTATPSGTADPAGGSAGVDPSRATERTQEASPEAILRAVSRAYEDVHAIRADFEQRLENRLLGRTILSAGTIYQRQPDLFLMEFSDPAGDLLVSDGEFFWMYYPSADSTQVIRTRRTASGLDLRSQFIGDPVQRFEIDYHGMEPVRDRPAHVMTLTPREPAGYESLRVWIDAEDHFVRRFDLAESSGVVRHFQLSDLAINPSLPADLFEFTPPPGARVVTR
jgi:outer membrane lipoprotein carrier protein